MKKLYFSALSIIFSLSLSAQLTQGNHSPVVGDQYSTYQCDSTFVPSAITGAGSLWNYSPTTHSSVIKNYTVSVNANPAYTLATKSVASSGSNILYFKDSPTNLIYYGGYLNLNGVAGVINYTTSPAVYASYPMSMGNSTTSTIGGTLIALGSPGTFDGTASVTVNGTGTLTLPAKTFSAVTRLLTVQNMTFNVPGTTTGTIIQTTYDYYSLGDSRYPILSHVTSYLNTQLSGSSTQSMAAIQKQYQSVGLREASKEEVTLNVYPNPSGSNVNFVTENTNAGAVSVHDINGKLIENAVLTNGKLNLNVSAYSNGVYIYKLLDANKGILKTGKLTVAH